MALPVDCRRKVGRDLAAGFGYNEGQSRGLGERFLNAVDSSFDAIERYPVAKVLHTARDPKLWPRPGKMTGQGDR